MNSMFGGPGNGLGVGGCVGELSSTLGKLLHEGRGIHLVISQSDTVASHP